MGDMLAWVELMACLNEWHAIIIVIIIIEVLSWGKNVECLYLEQKKNIPKRFEQWLKRRTWLEEQVLVYIIWTGNARILNMPESAEIGPKCWQICHNMCNPVNMLEYGWNIGCLNKPGLYSWLNLQNMKKLLLHNTLIMCLKLTKYVFHPEYAWISHGFWRCFNIHEYAPDIWPTSIHLFKVRWNDHLVSYFSLM